MAMEDSMESRENTGVYENRWPPPQPMCPHCGALPGVDTSGLIADHDEPETPSLCPGSYQVPRNHEADKRRLWNGKPNPHIAARLDDDRTDA